MNEFDKSFSKKQLEKERKKKKLLIGIGFCIVLIIILLFMIVYYKKLDERTFKLYINNLQVGYGSDFVINENGETYVKAKDIANYIQWIYQNGEYGTFTEDSNSGYIQNEYEVASFISGSNTLRKYIEVTAQPYTNEQGVEVQPFEVNSEEGTLESLTLELPIIEKENQIYFPLKCLSDICNCRVNYNNPYRMYIYDQKYLINLAQINAVQFGFQNISGVYENMRALAYGKMVVNRGSLYGVISLDDGSDIIGMKYTDMVFAQNVKEFFVKTILNDEESVGIIDFEVNSIISPKNYNSIQVLSDELGLYLVKRNDEYGVVNRNGEIVIYCEYDFIGISEELINSFKLSLDENKYLLFNKAIVVSKNGKYGLYNISGKPILATSYAGLGYVVNNDEKAIKNSESVLSIDLGELVLSNGNTRNLKVIIVQQLIDNVIKYGVYDAESEKLILPCIYDRIYKVRSNGVTEYYIEFQGQTAKLSEQIIQNPEIFE